MQNVRQVSLFKNGSNQALRIPKEFELDSKEALIYKDGDRLIVSPVKKNSLSTLLASWEPLEEEFPEITDHSIKNEDIF